MNRRVTKHLLTHSNQACAETHNVVLRGPRTRGNRSFAVAVTVSSDTSEIKKSQKRVSKDERRSMAESFVNKYRAMNSGNFPSVSTVKNEVGGSYYNIRNIVQELQHRSQMPSTSTRNNTMGDAKLQKNADVILGTRIAIKNSKLATNEEDGPTLALAEKSVSEEIAAMPTMTLERTVSLKKNKLANQEEDGPSSALDEKTLSDGITTTTLGATAEVKKVELTSQEADEPTSLDYKTFSEEIAKLSATDDNSAETAHKSYLLKEEAKNSYSTTRISEDSTREKTTSIVDHQQQSSNLENVTRDRPEEHEKKPFTWNLRSLADGFMKIWRKL